MPLRELLDQVPHVSFHRSSGPDVNRVLVVVLVTVVVNQLEIHDESFRAIVSACLNFLLDGRHIHWLCDDIVVVWYLLGVNWLEEGPGQLEALHLVEELAELDQLHALRRFELGLGHDIRRNPAACANGRHGAQVDWNEVTFCPLLRRLVNYVTVSQGAELVLEDILLFPEYAIRFEIAKFVESVALHESCCFVVLV